MADHHVLLPRDTGGMVLLAFGWLGKAYDVVVIQCMIDAKQWCRGSGGLFNVRSGYGRQGIWL